MKWVNLCHLYQPPTQDPRILRRIVQECYRPLCDIFRRHPQARCTFNMTGGLCDLWREHGYGDLIRGFGDLLRRGQIELTASAQYHPILPLLPEDELVRQIELNTAALRTHFGRAFKPRGFFPPEMAVSPRLLRILKNSGFQWVIADEISVPDAATRRTGICRDISGMTVVLKERLFSGRLAGGRCRSVADFLRWGRDRDSGATLTATDGEIYGHHYRGMDILLERLYEHPGIETLTMSDWVETARPVRTARLRECSWNSRDDELKQGMPFALWDDPGNPIHQTAWALVRWAHVSVDFTRQRHGHNRRWKQARLLMDQAWYSCPYWWASAKPWWDAGQVRKIIPLVMRVVTMVSQVSADVSWHRYGMELSRRLSEELRSWEKNGIGKRRQRDFMRK